MERELPIRVEIEGNHVAEFPDGTDPKVIDMVVKRDIQSLKGTSTITKPTEQPKVSHTQTDNKEGVLPKIGKGMWGLAKNVAPLADPDYWKAMDTPDKWKRQQATLNRLSDGLIALMGADVNIPQGLMSKIIGMKKSGMKFGEIYGKLTPDEQKLAMSAIKPPSLVEHEVKRITPGLMR